MADIAPDLPNHDVEINLGPSNPAMNATVRVRLRLEGETIVRSHTEIGYGHRGFEKSCEASSWADCLPYVERLNHVSPLINSFAYSSALDRLLGVKPPERALWIRVLMSELSRILEHLTCTAAIAHETGSVAGSSYLIRARASVWALIEQVCGARVNVNYARIGGVARDLPEGFVTGCREALEVAFGLIADADALLTRNKIFVDRLNGVGQVGSAEALAHGATGPFLRAAGHAFDLRKAKPYDVYGALDFEVAVGTHGDCYDRWLCRLEEMRQSRKMVLQCLDKMPRGEVLLPNMRINLSVIDGQERPGAAAAGGDEPAGVGEEIPSGEVYGFAEGANGEVGFYLVADGGDRPLKCRMRSPAFALMPLCDSALFPGAQLGDVMPILATLNVIGSECDR